MLHSLLWSLCLLASSAARPSSSSTLDAALLRIDAERIRSDLHFIASNELEGRDTPSSGQRIAARFLRARLERLHFQPGAGDGYFYVYDLQPIRIDPSATHATVTAGAEVRELEWSVDWIFSSRGLADRDVEGPLVFLGAGSAEDFGELDLAGRIALVELPTEKNWSAGSQRARAAGALGIVFAPDPAATPAPFEGDWERWETSSREGRLGGARRSSSSAEAPEFASLVLARGAAREVFELAGYPGEPPATVDSGEPPAEGAALSRPAVGTELAVRLHDVRKIDSNAPAVTAENVCGLWPGSDPTLAREVVLLTAHYDHVGVGERGIYPGADDNGSGTCALLALAEALASHGPLARSVLLMWVSGEEKGLLGSRAWSLAPQLPPEYRVVCNINLDMVGRNAPDSLLITPSSEHPSHNGLVELAQSLAPLEGFPALGAADQYYQRSDHAMFAENMGVPVCFLFSDVHEDYHQPTDTPDKVDCDKIRRVARLVTRMVFELQKEELDF